VPAAPAAADHSGRLVFLVGLLVTLALAAGVAKAWPADGGPEAVRSTATPTTLMTPEVAATFQPGVPPAGSTSASTVPRIDLFEVGPSFAVHDILSAAGNPSQLIEVTVFPGYLFVAYRDPAAPDHLDRRMWRDGNAQEADANPIDDRVDADTTPKLFTAAELEPALDQLPTMIADAPSRYDVPVTVTHVIIDRFLPFDERVLVRVYASPADGRSGGGYVSYTTAGEYVETCC
jgi:hypothetical protein